MEIDIILEPNLTPAQIAELGVAAERHGIRALWTSNYFAHWDAFLSLVPLAQQTSRLLMGALAVSPFEMHPLKIANSLLTLNEMSGGRALLAIGAGEGNLEAMALTKPEKIVGAVREATEIVMAAGRGGLAKGYQGQHFNVKFPCSFDWLKQKNSPYVYVTCYRHQMMKMAGKVADGVYLGAIPTEIIAPAMAAVRDGQAARATPRVHAPRVNAFWGWHIKHDRAKAHMESRRELAWRGRKLDADVCRLYLSEAETQLVVSNFQAFVDAWFDRSGIVKGIPDEVCNRLMYGLTSTGGLEDMDREVERFRTFERAGLTEISLRLHEDPMEGLDIIGKHLLPRLR
jgi:5,10-methylenetetrahydromethanopterin reductase